MNNYFRNIWLGVYTVLVGMRITLIHLFMKKVTNQYPDKYPDVKSLEKSDLIPLRARNRLVVDMEECNGCKGCERDCPVNCITVETVRAVPGDNIPQLRSGGKRTLWVLKHEIDFAKCCFCSLCTLDCPTQAIFHTTEFEYSTYDRNSLKINFSKMTEVEIKDKLDKFDKMQAEKKAAKPAAAPAVAIAADKTE